MIHKREGCSGGSWRLEYVLKYPLDPAWDRCQGQCSGPAHQIEQPVCISTGAWSPPVTLSWPHSDVMLSLPIKQRTAGVVSGRGGRGKDLFPGKCSTFCIKALFISQFLARQPTHIFILLHRMHYCTQRMNVVLLDQLFILYSSTKSKQKYIFKATNLKPKIVWRLKNALIRLATKLN